LVKELVKQRFFINKDFLLGLNFLPSRPEYLQKSCIFQGIRILTVEAEVGNVRKTFTWELRNRLPEGVVDKERFLM
jgi:hypothetical protein